MWHSQGAMNLAGELWLVGIASASLVPGCMTGGLDGGTTGSGDTANVDVDYGPDEDSPDRDDPADRADDPDDDGELVPADECEACVDQRCEATYGRCDANADCVALAECGSRCNDEACYQNCEQTYPGGVDDLMAHFGCIDTNCAQPCGGNPDDGGGDQGAGDDGGFDDGEGGDQGGDDQLAEQCDACAQQACPAQYDECLNSQDCLAFVDCASQCQDDACWENCWSENEEGANTYYALDECAYQNCRQECGFENG